MLWGDLHCRGNQLFNCSVSKNIKYMKISLHIASYRAAAYDVICLEAIVFPGGKAMECLYGNGRTFTSFLLTSPALVIEHLLY